jgi:hypothetical protein
LTFHETQPGCGTKERLKCGVADARNWDFVLKAAVRLKLLLDHTAAVVVVRVKNDS